MSNDVDNNTGDQFDELFEPFELPDTPPEDQPPRARQPVAPRTEAATKTPQGANDAICTSCGAHNPAHNRHCEQCGARLSQEALPVAPPPMVRATAGGRALGVLAAVVLLVALAALMFNILRGGGDVPDATDSTTTPSSTAPPIVQEVFASAVDASSELTGFEAANLIDSNIDTYWNDESARGKDAQLTFRFARPVALSEIEFLNLVDETKFKRNYRIQGYVIRVDDLEIEIAGRLEDTNERQLVKIASLETVELEILITSTYPAQAVGDAPPFDELALNAVRFFGTER